MPYRLAVFCLILASTVVTSAQDLPAGHPKPAAAARTDAATGKVLQVIKAGRYIYLDLETATGKIWVATAATEVKVGDSVTVNHSMPMKDFYSQTLEQRFDMVYFADGVTVQGAEVEAPAVPAGHPSISSGTRAKAETFDLSGIEKAPGGYTVAEVYASAASLAGREIALRGKVVKFNLQILDHNWIHLRDGTGTTGSNDLTVTTQAEVKPGDLVTVKGQLALDRDFGHGYRYAVIMEDASVEVEGLPFAPSRLSTVSGKLADGDAYYDAETCADCHEQQFADWQGSAHSRAHTDGIYLAFAEKAREEGGEPLYVFCSACHAPLAVATGEIPGQAGKKATFLTHEGVSCDACHARDKKFRESPVDCFACHSDKDRHNGQLGADCANCHSGADTLAVGSTADSTAHLSGTTSFGPAGIASGGSGGTTTCTGACHTGQPTVLWSATSLNCDACHGNAPTTGEHTKHTAGAALTLGSQPSSEDLRLELEKLLDSPDQLGAMAIAAGHLGRPDAVTQLADQVTRLVEGG